MWFGETPLSAAVPVNKNRNKKAGPACGVILKIYLLWAQLIEPAVASFSGRSPDDSILGPSWHSLHVGLRQYSRGVIQTFIHCHRTLSFLVGIYRMENSHTMYVVNQTGFSLKEAQLFHVCSIDERKLRANFSDASLCTQAHKLVSFASLVKRSLEPHCNWCALDISICLSVCRTVCVSLCSFGENTTSEILPFDFLQTG